MGNSAVILTDGSSRELDQGLIPLAGRPLISYAVDAVHSLVDEVIVVVSSEFQIEKFKILPNIRIVVNENNPLTPLVGALTGFKAVKGDLALLLSYNAPLLSSNVLALILDLCINRNAVIPRWPDGHIEPLHAAYKVKAATVAAEAAFNCGQTSLLSMVERLRGVRYISTLTLQQFDPKLTFFFNINTPSDLKTAERLLKKIQKHNFYQK
ncbi:MAG: NTP transferase domain-containing protein [Candidatus Bathyarchaeia archaeon]